MPDAGGGGKQRQLAVVILSSNERAAIEAHLSEIVAAIEASQPGRFLLVEFGS